MINAETKLLCLLGTPVSQSMSPLLHNELFKTYGVNCVYVAFNVLTIKKAVAGLKALQFLGANITIPFKSEIIKFLDIVNDQSTGAVNTVLNKNEKLYGFNTDIYGIQKALPVKNKKVVILGAGGACRAACAALSSNDITVITRNCKKAQHLERNFDCTVTHLGTMDKVVPESNIIINATPVGMVPHVNQSLVPQNLLHETHTVFDMVYNPKETKLLKDAHSVGAKTVFGTEMFIYQALKSFEIWTKIIPDEKIARKVIS